MHHGQIKWPEIFVEGCIFQVPIDVKEKGIFDILRGFDVRYKEEFA